MRRKLMDVPCIAALCNTWKSKHVLSKLYSVGIYLKGDVLALYKNRFNNLNFCRQINLTKLSNSLIQESAFLRNCFSMLFFHRSLISIYFGVNYKPINKNCHEEMDAFNFSKRFCTL